MPVWTVVPFVVMLASIAVLPLIRKTSSWWEKQPNQFAVALVLGLVATILSMSYGYTGRVLDSVVEYAQFIVLLGGLFVVSGGIALTGDLAGTPKVNTVFMAIGAVLASFIGTTGAAMLLIRPLLVSNGHRKHRAHTVIFSIFILANCGGLLTPLGDPPLFLGMLRGVPFTWTLTLWKEWLFVNGLLLLTYFCVDKYMVHDEDQTKDIVEKLGIVGKIQVLWFALIIVSVAFLPSVDLHTPTSWWDYIPWREIVILIAAALSWITSHDQARFTINEFTWVPIREVAILFLGIFLSMVPALVILDEHADSLPLNAVTYNLFTGGLSSILDNAPTYATFFEVARSQATQTGVLIAGVPQMFLVAISTGAVFWGAMTYIGNGPNLMVRAIATARGVAMPSFFGYIAWSGRWLLPILIAQMLIFIADPWWAKAAGSVIALCVVVRAILLAKNRWPKVQPAEPLSRSSSSDDEF